MDNILELFKQTIIKDEFHWFHYRWFFNLHLIYEFKIRFFLCLFLYYIIDSLKGILFCYINRILKCSLNGNLQLTLNSFFVFKKQLKWIP